MFTNKKFKFAVVGHSEELADAVRGCINPDKEEVAVKVVNMGESVQVARQLVEEGTEIIFGHMGNAHLMFQEIGQHMVEIPRTHLDMMIAFSKARKYSSHIGLTNYGEPTDGIKFIERILGIKVHQIIFKSFTEMEQGVNDAYENGVHTIVGGGVSSKIITALGGKSIVVEPRKSAVEKSFREARAIASLRRKEAENSARVKTILQMVDDGVIGVDKFGRIDIYNQNAEKILGKSLKPAVGQSQTGILKDMRVLDVLTSGQPEKDVIKKVGSNNVVVNALPITIGGTSQGAVALFKTVTRIQNINRKLNENLYLKGFVAKHTLDTLVGKSASMRQLKTRISQYARTHTTIMIQGETGTGKELAAQAIHNLSPQRHQPFVAINCAALPETLLESELFGYEEGAFTGAKRGGKIGLFELANNGTVFLDEIADISPGLQMRLLRVIENKEVMRVGGDRYVPVEVRIISSSYKDLRGEIKKGNFRPDLYYRLAVLKLRMPPLRDKLEDIPLILKNIIERHGKTGKAFTEEMYRALTGHYWPGNVRELISFAESYLTLLGKKQCSRSLFDMLLKEQMEDASLPEICKTETEECIPAERLVEEMPDGTLKEMLEAYENKLLDSTLRTCHFNKKATADRLGISVNTLWRKLNSKKADVL